MTGITEQDRQDFRKWKMQHFFRGNETLFSRALDQDRIAFAKILLEQGAGHNALYRAVRNKDNRRVKNLLAAGVDPNEGEDSDGDCMPPLCVAASYGNLYAAKLLIEAGCNLNAQTFAFSTPLIVAIVNGQPVIADLLMAHGADPTIQGKRGLTALERAKSDAKPFVKKLEAYEKEWKAANAPQTLLLPPPAAAVPVLAAAQDDGWSYVGGAGCDMVIQKISDAASDTHIKNIFDFAAKRFITEIVSNGNPPQMIVEKLDNASETLLAQARRKRDEKKPQEPGLT
jgi:hypothetical protein